MRPAKRVKCNGRVKGRSSDGKKGPPGEAEILKLNPQRRELILAKTKWDDLFPGTLNVKVDPEHVRALSHMAPHFEEEPVKYPIEYAKIPIRRGGYEYFKARLRFTNPDGKQKVDVLVRRCRKKQLKDILEVVAPMSLKEGLRIANEDEISLSIRGGVRLPPEGPWQCFFTADGVHMPIEGAFQGAHAFFIGSGPSFALVPPEIKRQLGMCFTAMVNNGPRAAMPEFRPSLWTCMDGADKFLHTTWEDPRILKLVPKCHAKDKHLWDSDTDAPRGLKVTDCPNVFFYNRNNEFDADLFLAEHSVNWGSSKDFRDANGVKGKRSVFLASLKLLYVLGFRHVYLLGVDFHMEEGEQNYAFDQQRKRSAVHGNNATYEQNMWRCKELRKRFDAAGFEVFNCNPDSALTAFEQMPVDRAIERALNYTGNPVKWLAGEMDATAGLYETKWYVCPGCKKDQRLSKEQCQETYECACGKVHDRARVVGHDADNPRTQIECKCGVTVTADMCTSKYACECGRLVTERDRHKHAKDPTQDEAEG